MLGASVGIEEPGGRRAVGGGGLQSTTLPNMTPTRVRRTAPAVMATVAGVVLAATRNPITQLPRPSAVVVLVKALGRRGMERDAAGI